MPTPVLVAIITASGAAIVAIISMFVSIWVARKQRQSYYVSKELDDQYIQERQRREALDGQIIKAELLRVRAREMIRLMELSSPKTNKGMQEKLNSAQEVFDAASRDFLESWGQVRSQIEPSLSVDLIRSQKICSDAIDAIEVSVLLGRRGVSPTQYVYEMKQAGERLDNATLEFQAALLTHKALKSTALAKVKKL